MKNITKILSIVILVFAFSANVLAQATAIASATIVTPITIVHVSDLSFGNVVPSATTAGTVDVAPDGTPSYTDVTATALPAATATITAASFNVSGTPAATYDITLPVADVTLTGPAGTMIANTFVSDPSGTGTLDGTTGTQTLNVGATLHVGVAQAAGTYTSAPFTVTVNYN
ncbi:MAG TPA: DUF4402 domain-containing protein [Bacteroidales bacterium]|nr:DUF4402 domain-containing protein [Bacteroidales bacterium]